MPQNHDTNKSPKIKQKLQSQFIQFNGLHNTLLKKMHKSIIQVTQFIFYTSYNKTFIMQEKLLKIHCGRGRDEKSKSVYEDHVTFKSVAHWGGFLS